MLYRVVLIISFLGVTCPFSNSLHAQSFGFGCLGFVGGYGGFSYQVYKPTGLNSYVQGFNNFYKDSLESPMDSFGHARGFRAGINFFRANFTGLILTTKGFYQALTEKKDASITSADGVTNTTYQLDIKNWGVGVDLGTSITKALSWKVIDAAVLFNSAKFTNTKNLPGAVTQVLEYTGASSSIGYSIGTGFILAVIGDYVSIEGLVGYTVFSIDKMQLSDGTPLTISENSKEEMKNFIEAAGFNAVIQLNIGFPL